MSKSQYTVIGFHDEDTHIFCEHVMAECPSEAVVKAARMAVKSLDKKGFDANYAMECINIVEIFKGHLESVNDCSEVTYAIDWEGVKWPK